MQQKSSVWLVGSSLFLGLTVTLAIPSPTLAAGETTRVSVTSKGSQGNKNWNIGHGVAISVDGRFLAFSCQNLVSGVTRYGDEICLRDRSTGKTSQVDVALDGSEADDLSASWRPAISADGRYVAFVSEASDLVLGDTGFRSADIFVRDRQTGQTTRVSVASSGKEADDESDSPAISADGRYIAFVSDADNLVPAPLGFIDYTPQIFLHDRVTRITSMVSVASDGTHEDARSDTPAISADGRFVAFYSESDTLVSDDTNAQSDTFVHDRATNKTERVSITSDGSQGNGSSAEMTAISANGRYVAFASDASNLVTEDTNASTDIFVHDRQTRKTTRVSVSSSGRQGNDNSGAGYRAFWSDDGLAMSADGRYVTFYSVASNLVSGDTNGMVDIFVHDRVTSQTTRASVASDGKQGNNHSSVSAISGDGRFVGMDSAASNLVAADTNGTEDVFVRDRLLQAGQLADLAVTQTESADPVVKSTLITYSVKVTNNGPQSAPSVVMTDTLPMNAILQSITPSVGSCYKGPISVCRLGTIQSGASANVTVTLKANRVGTLTNTTYVNGSPTDSNTSNNSSKITSRVIN